jgi:2-haloacid dehalogenase
VTLSFDDVDVLTFDCYGTLIDWEAGLLSGLRPLLARADATLSDDELLEGYAAIEAELEAGPYLPYREILAEGLRRLADAHGATPTADEVAAFSRSVEDWPAFPDSADALRRLAHRFRLGVITNCDDDLFAASSRRLGVPFDWVVTAQQARSYKPDPRPFELAFERIGAERARILHVAQSLYHDHVPARALGLRTAWIHRRHGREGFGATPPAQAVPDLVARSMVEFADLALDGAQAGR